MNKGDMESIDYTTSKNGRVVVSEQDHDLEEISEENNEFSEDGSP